MKNYSIGEASRRTGVKVTTIRFYEARGLLPPPDRTENGQRRYDAAGLKRLAFIRHARELGFDLADIGELASMVDQPERPCEDVHDIAERQLHAVERRLAILEKLRVELGDMVARCKGGEVGTCGVIEVLGDHRLCRTESHLKPDPDLG